MAGIMRLITPIQTILFLVTDPLPWDTQVVVTLVVARATREYPTQGRGFVLAIGTVSFSVTLPLPRDALPRPRRVITRNPRLGLTLGRRTWKSTVPQR